MPLKFKVTTLDGIDASLHSFYESTDGGYQLTVEGLPEPENVDNLKSALAKERKDAKDARTALKGFTALYETPEQITEAIDAARTEAGGKDPKETQEYQLMKGKVDQLTTENETLKSSNAKTRSAAEGVIQSQALQSSLVEAKATPAGIEFLEFKYRDRVKVTINDDGSHSVSVYQEDGETPMIGSGKDGAATVSDLIKEDALKNEKYNDFFQGTNQGGGGKPPGGPGGSGGSGKSMTRTAFDALSPGEKSAKMQEGFTVTDE